VKIVFAPLAARDLKEAYDFIARDNPEAADRVLAEISETIGLLASRVVRGRPVTLRSGERIRTWSHPPYRLYYRIFREVLQVVRIYHQARKPLE
jgi:plasmid stabilization system protein ParE